MEPCGSLGELSRGDITSPVIEAGQSLVKELEPVQRSITEAAATAKAVGVNQVSITLVDMGQLTESAPARS